MATTFAPKQSSSNDVSATTTTASGTLDPTCPQVRVVNLGTVTVRCRWGKGAQTAVTTDMAIAAGATESFTKQDADTIAFITASGSATVNVTSGHGD
jgi:hypothetical protein